MKEKSNQPSCATCPFPEKKRICKNPDGKGPNNCPTLNSEPTIDKALEVIKASDLYPFYKTSLEGSGKLVSRVEETIVFCKKMGYQKLGLAFCIGLKREAKIVHEIFTANGFEMVSAICKIGRKTKNDFMSETDNFCKTNGVVCNPVGQAMILNKAGAEFNLVLGLCVGHDSLFFSHAKAPVTVLVAKDRLQGHNPVGAINTYTSYQSHLKNVSGSGSKG